jgi:hypothetical protein
MRHRRIRGGQPRSVDGAVTTRISVRIYAARYFKVAGTLLDAKGRVKLPHSRKSGSALA